MGYFIAWMCCYPLASVIGNYIGAKRRKEDGKPPFSDNMVGLASLIETCIYIIVARHLWV